MVPTRCRSGSEGLGFAGIGAVSPLRDAKTRAKVQQPLRQLLSGNSNQARDGSSFRKPDFLGGGAAD